MVSACLALCAAALLHAQTYDPIELQPLAGDVSADAVSAAKGGFAVGFSVSADGKRRLVAWDLKGKPSQVRWPGIPADCVPLGVGASSAGRLAMVVRCQDGSCRLYVQGVADFAKVVVSDEYEVLWGDDEEGTVVNPLFEDKGNQGQNPTGRGQDNPLYNGSGNSGQNPLYEPKSSLVVNPYFVSNGNAGEMPSSLPSQSFDLALGRLQPIWSFPNFHATSVGADGTAAGIVASPKGQRTAGIVHRDLAARSFLLSPGPDQDCDGDGLPDRLAVATLPAGGVGGWGLATDSSGQNWLTAQYPVPLAASAPKGLRVVQVLDECVSPTGRQVRTVVQTPTSSFGLASFEVSSGRFVPHEVNPAPRWKAPELNSNSDRVSSCNGVILVRSAMGDGSVRTFRLAAR